MIRAWVFLSAAAMCGIGLVGCGDAATGTAQQGVAVDQTASAEAFPDCHSRARPIVSFGDSLTDVGTYDVGEVAALGGGKYTVNSPQAKTWTEVLASYLGRPAPCAAETGLDGSAAYGFNVPVTTHAGCTDYAQGGARVTNPVGPGNALLGGSNAILGSLTVPVVTQIQNHLAISGGAFDPRDLVTVYAGANDAFIHLSTIGAGGETPTAGVTAMGTAGAELAGYVVSEILGKGAKKVVVLTVPDINTTPLGQAKNAQTQGLISELVTTFNTYLKQGLAGSGALIVDSYAFSQTTAAHPDWFGITNTTTPACDLSPSVNPLGSSLVCTTATEVAGAQPTWAFADAVHPTPYTHGLLADFVFAEMLANGYL